MNLDEEEDEAKKKSKKVSADALKKNVTSS